MVPSDPNTEPNTVSTDLLPTALLLNGGVFNSSLITQRLIALLSDWLGRPITLLDNPHPDWSVALGAVAYAKARRGAQLKIGGGAARSYFLHLQEKNKLGKALCLLAKGSEEGQEIRLTSRRFALTVGEPVRFNLLTSTHEHITQEQRVQNGALFTIDTDKFQPCRLILLLYPHSTHRACRQPKAARRSAIGLPINRGGHSANRVCQSQ